MGKGTWAALLAAAWEGGWWVRRRGVRSSLYVAAQREAARLRRPLVVVGAPDRGPTPGPGCGDVTIDIDGSSCPSTLTADITRRLPLANDSVVVFVSCVLEYVADLPAAVAELARVSGGHLYVTRVEPWTLTAYAYPGARRTITARDLPRSAVLG